MLYVKVHLFRNTALQILLHSKKFIKSFLSVFDINDSITTRIYEIMIAFYDSTDYSSCDPTGFLNAFEFYHKKFKGFKQHDSQEFLRILLEDLSKELNTVIILPKYRELETTNKNKKELNLNFHKMFIDRENSIIVDLFYSQICNTFTCSKCYNQKFSFEKIVDIPLLIGIKGLKKKMNFIVIYMI